MGLLILQMPCECHVKSMQLAINSCTLFISRLLFFISHECVCVCFPQMQLANMDRLENPKFQNVVKCHITDSVQVS